MSGHRIGIVTVHQRDGNLTSLNASVASCPYGPKCRARHERITMTARWQTAFILAASLLMYWQLGEKLWGTSL